MKEVNITITSKNQITLPIKLVRKYNLSPGSQLKAHSRGGKIVLEPQGDPTDNMRKYWGKHQAKKPLTDKQLKKAVRQAAADNAG